MYGNVDCRSLPCWCGASITPNQEGINWCFPRGLWGKIKGFCWTLTFSVPNHIRKQMTLQPVNRLSAVASWSRYFHGFWSSRNSSHSLIWMLAVSPIITCEGVYQIIFDHFRFSNRIKTTRSLSDVRPVCPTTVGRLLHNNCKGRSDFCSVFLSFALS